MSVNEFFCLDLLKISPSCLEMYSQNVRFQLFDFVAIKLYWK